MRNFYDKKLNKPTFERGGSTCRYLGQRPPLRSSPLWSYATCQLRHLLVTPPVVYPFDWLGLEKRKQKIVQSRRNFPSEIDSFRSAIDILVDWNISKVIVAMIALAIPVTIPFKCGNFRWYRCKFRTSFGTEFLGVNTRCFVPSSRRNFCHSPSEDALLYHQTGARTHVLHRNPTEIRLGSQRQSKGWELSRWECVGIVHGSGECVGSGW